MDPQRAVDRAVITHGHSDHARPGHGSVLATSETLAIMRERMGADRAGNSQQPLRYGVEVLHINGVKLWLRPAGHVLGSAQVCLEWQGSRAVISGDYKRRPDPTQCPSSWSAATSSSPRRPSRSPYSITRRRSSRSRGCCEACGLFPSEPMSSAATPLARRSG